MRSLAFILAVFLILPGRPAPAAAPDAEQVHEVLRQLYVDDQLKVTGEKVAKGIFEAAVTMDSKSAKLYGYTPVGSEYPTIAVLIDKIAMGKILGGTLELAFKDMALKNVTMLLVPFGNNRENARPRDLPKFLEKRMEKVVKSFDLIAGVNIFANVDGTPKGLAGDALKAIGLTTVRDLTVQVRVGESQKSLILKKTGKWRNPFKLKKVGRSNTYIEGLTLMVSQTDLIDPQNMDETIAKKGTSLAIKRAAKKAGKEIPPAMTRLSGWGRLNLNKKAYLMFTQQVFFKGKIAGKAYGLDAPAITAKSLADLAAAMPWSNGFAAVGLDQLPLDAVKLENPNYRRFDANGNVPPSFENMALVAATPGVRLPDKKKIANVDQLSKDTPGPLIYANGAASVFGERVGNIEARLSVHGLKVDASVKARSIGPVKYEGEIDFKLGPKENKPAYDHEMKLTGTASLHGLINQSVIMTADIHKMRYEIPASCPLNPTTISASVPHATNFAFDGLKKFDVSIGVSDCFTDAIIGVVKDPRKLVTATADLAEESIELATDVGKDVADKIVNADKTLKDAWKTSIDAGKTAANAVTNLNNSINSVGRQITKAVDVIEDLGSEIKDLAKKIGSFFKGEIKKLKKKRKRKKSEKRKLETKKARLERTRNRARKALQEKSSPYFDPNVTEARSEHAALRFEKKLADARKAYATQLKKDFANKRKRVKLLAAIDVQKIVSEQVQAIKTASTDPMSATQINKLLADNSEHIQAQVIAAAYEKAMDAHLAAIKPDPEPDVPFDTPIRIVGEFNMCLEAYRKVPASYGYTGLAKKFAKLSDFIPQKIRVSHCHTEKQKAHDEHVFSTQRFRLTKAGKLEALFDDKTVCFDSRTEKLGTVFCQNIPRQIFFPDPTITSLRPLMAQKSKEPRCMSRRLAARNGALVELRPCAYAKDGNSVGKHQTWTIAKWTDKLPKKVKVPAQPSSWKHYGGDYAGATTAADKTRVVMNGLVRILPRDTGGKLDHTETIDILPAAQRPDRVLIFNGNMHGGMARVDIFPTGHVRWKTANSTKINWVSLGNIAYPLKTGKKLTLKGGCKKYRGSTFREPSYVKHGKTIMLTGLLACPLKGKKLHLGTLPSGHRPAKTLIFSANAHREPARINIASNGRIEWIAGGGAKHDWISLDGISFTLSGSKTIQVHNKNCKNYGKGFGAARASVDNGVVRVSGLVACKIIPGKSLHMVRLPADMRPKKRLIFNVNAHEKSVRVDVLPNGWVAYIAGGRLDWLKPKWRAKDTPWVSLDGIAFAVKGSKSMALKW